MERKETQENLTRMGTCPRFAACSAPRCPLDELIAQRLKLHGEPECPYTTSKRSKRIRPIPTVVKQFIKASANGGFKSIFEKHSPERRDQ